VIDLERHGDQLDASGISVETATLARLRSGVEGLVFPYYNPAKRKFNGFERVRLDRPNGGQKYTQESGTGSRLYYPHAVSDELHTALLTSEVPIFIVEGEKKALALQERLQSRGCVIGLGGVWNWCKRRSFASRTRPLIDDFARVKISGRTAYVCFDSDVATNAQVRQAEEELSKALSEAKAEVRLLTLPSKDGERMGIDDWLVEWNDSWNDALTELCRSSVRTRVEIPPIYSFEEMLQESFPPIKVLLGEEGFPILNSGGLCYVHSMSGIGKTYFSMQMAHALSRGSAFLDHSAKRPLRVVFLQAELSSGWFQRRVRRLDEIFGPTETLWVMNGQMDLVVPAPYGKHEVNLLPLEQIISNYKADVVFIDPLQGFLDMPENSTDVNREFQRQLAKVRHKHECAIVITHHDRKMQDGESMHRMRGSSVLSDWADVVLAIDREKNEDDEYTKALILSYDKCRHAEGPRPEPTRLVRVERDGQTHPWLALDFVQPGDESDEETAQPCTPPQPSLPETDDPKCQDPELPIEKPAEESQEPK
jgi:hypothetical protein